MVVRQNNLSPNSTNVVIKLFPSWELSLSKRFHQHHLQHQQQHQLFSTHLHICQDHVNVDGDFPSKLRAFIRQSSNYLHRRSFSPHMARSLHLLSLKKCCQAWKLDRIVFKFMVIKFSQRQSQGFQKIHQDQVANPTWANSQKCH